MERCDFGLNDFIRSVRVSYDRAGKQDKASQRWSRFAEEEVVKCGIEMVSALVFLNTLTIVHMDVKVENILWKHAKTSGVYKLCDFGVIAFGEPPRLTVYSRGSPGTLWTQAPEVLRGFQRDSSCDVWSLGCVLYEMTLCVI